MAVAEFTRRIQTCSVVPFGTCGRRTSPHFFDQAQLYSSKKLKTAWFYRDEVEQHANRVVHPGTTMNPQIVQSHASASGVVRQEPLS